MNFENYWLLLAFTTPIILALNTIVNKWLIDKYFPDPITSLSFMLIANILFVFPATFLIDISLSWWSWLIVTSLGIVFGLMFYLQLKVVKERDASEVAIITRLKPIFVMILAVFLLGENLSTQDVLGILFLSLGGLVVASKDVDIKRFKISNHLSSLLAFVLISSLVSISRKAVLFSNDFWPVFYWINFGSMLGGFLLLLERNTRNKFIHSIKNSPMRVYVVKIFTQITFTLGFFANSKALEYGPVSIVSGVYSIQPFFVLLYSYAISKYFPNVIKEDISKSTLIKRVIAILFMILGSLLVI